MEKDTVTVNLVEVKSKLFDLYTDRLFESEEHEDTVLADMMAASEVLNIIKELGGD